MGRKRGRGWIFDLYPSANTIVLWLIEEGGSSSAPDRGRAGGGDSPSASREASFYPGQGRGRMLDVEGRRWGEADQGSGGFDQPLRS